MSKSGRVKMRRIAGEQNLADHLTKEKAWHQIETLTPGVGGIMKVKPRLSTKPKLGEVVTTIPMTGGIVETVEYRDLSFTVCDVESRGESWLLRRKEGVQESVERGRNARCGGDGFLPLSRNCLMR